MKVLLNKNEHAGLVKAQLDKVRRVHAELAGLDKAEYYDLRAQIKRNLSVLNRYMMGLEAEPFTFSLLGQRHTVEFGSTFSANLAPTETVINIERTIEVQDGQNFVEVRTRRTDALGDAAMAAAVAHGERAYKALQTYGHIELGLDSDGRFLEFDTRAEMLRVVELKEQLANAVMDSKQACSALKEMCDSIPEEREMKPKEWWASLFSRTARSRSPRTRPG